MNHLPRPLHAVVIGIVAAALLTPAPAGATSALAHGAQPFSARVPAADEASQPAALSVDPAELDAGFGTAGKVMTNIGGHRAFAVALQPDGRIVVAGEGNGGFGVARYTTSGAPDPTFDEDGMATIDVGIWDDASALAIQSDGKIVLVGPNSPGGYCCEAAIVRLTTSGAPDSTFDSDGIVTTGLGGPLFGANAVAIQPDGKILVGGGEPFTIGRFTTAGALDTTFGTGGWVEADMGSTSAVSDIAVQSDGKIVGVGASNGDFGVVRYTTAGALDSTFDGDGKVATDFGTQYDGAAAVAIQGDGSIVVAGTGNNQLAVARYTSAGALDSTFDGDGKATTVILGKNIESGADVAIQGDGKIVVVGRAFDDYDSEYGIVRWDTDGWLDGRMITTFAERADDWAQGVAIQSDGRIVVVGGLTGCSSACSWTMARYTGVTPLRTLGASPSSVDFGTVTLGAPPASAGVSITNTGSVSLTIGTVAATGMAVGVSIATDSCSAASIAPKSSCTVDLAYAPTAVGTLAAELLIPSDADTSPLIVPLQGTAMAPPSGVTWGSAYAAGPAYTWNGGNALGRTVQSGTQRLHLAYATDRVNGTWAKDIGPYVGVYYVRSSSGSSWTRPKRVSSSTQHAGRLALTAGGSRVYAAWVTVTRWHKFSPTAPRVLYVRVNTNHGASTSWRSAVRLTSTSGRVDYPAIAATGSDVYIAYTDANTGAVRLARSHDRGVTWSKRSVGSTAISTSQGKTGLPFVAASGSTVVVTWLSDVNGTVKARISTDRGGTWGTVQTVGGQSIGTPTAAVLGSRIAVAWTTPDDVVVRQRISGTWQPAKVIASLPAGEDPVPYGAQVALSGTTRIGVAWSAEKSTPYYSELKWAESANGGTVWFAAQTLASTSSSSRRANDLPSVLWPTASTRFVVWNGWTYGTYSYRLYLRKGSGAPVGPTSVATTWSPANSDEPTFGLPERVTDGAATTSVRLRIGDQVRGPR